MYSSHNKVYSTHNNQQRCPWAPSTQWLALTKPPFQASGSTSESQSLSSEFYLENHQDHHPTHFPHLIMSHQALYHWVTLQPLSSFNKVIFSSFARLSNYNDYCYKTSHLNVFNHHYNIGWLEDPVLDLEQVTLLLNSNEDHVCLIEPRVIVMNLRCYWRPRCLADLFSLA